MQRGALDHLQRRVPGGACGSNTCEVGEICSSFKLPWDYGPTPGCFSPSDEPELVAQGTLACDYGSGGARISGGMVFTSCYCSSSGC